MGVFEEHDTVSLVKRNGKRTDDIPANVQPNVIFISNGDLPIEEGDFLERQLPNGLWERYVVVDRGYYSTGILGPHYQCKVRKQFSM